MRCPRIISNRDGVLVIRYALSEESLNCHGKRGLQQDSCANGGDSRAPASKAVKFTLALQVEQSDSAAAHNLSCRSATSEQQGDANLTHANRSQIEALALSKTRIKQEDFDVKLEKLESELETDDGLQAQATACTRPHPFSVSLPVESLLGLLPVEPDISAAPSITDAIAGADSAAADARVCQAMVAYAQENTAAKVTSISNEAANQLQQTMPLPPVMDPFGRVEQASVNAPLNQDLDDASIRRLATNFYKAKRDYDRQRARFGEMSYKSFVISCRLNLYLREIEKVIQHEPHSQIMVERGFWDICSDILETGDLFNAETVVKIFREQFPRWPEASFYCDSALKQQDKLFDKAEYAPIWPALVIVLGRCAAIGETHRENYAYLQRKLIWRCASEILCLCARRNWPALARLCANSELVRHLLACIQHEDSEIISWSEKRPPLDCLEWRNNCDKRSSFWDTRQSALETLFLVVQRVTPTLAAEQCVRLQGVEVMLKFLWPFSKESVWKSSTGSLDRHGILGDICFNLLCLLVDSPSGKIEFLRLKGYALMHNLLKFRSRKDDGVQPELAYYALQVLDYASSSRHGSSVCETLARTSYLDAIFASNDSQRDRYLKVGTSLRYWSNDLFVARRGSSELRSLVNILASLLFASGANTSAPDLIFKRLKKRDHEIVRQLVDIHISTSAEYKEDLASIQELESNSPQAIIPCFCEFSCVVIDDFHSTELDGHEMHVLAAFHLLRSCDNVLAWLVMKDAPTKKIVVAELAKAGLTLDSITEMLLEPTPHHRLRTQNESKEDDDDE